MYGINNSVYKNLINYFKNSSNINKVILFGSRAKGNESFNSDIDLCIDCPSSVFSTITNDIDNLVGIYSCDIVFLEKLNEELKKQIDKYGIEIYSKDFSITTP